MNSMSIIPSGSTQPLEVIDLRITVTNDNVIFVNANFNEEFWNKWAKIDLKKMEGNEATHVVALHCIGNLIKDNFKTLKNKNYETKELEYLALLQKILKRK